MAQNVNVVESGGLRMHVFVSKPVIFEVASVVLEGEREAALMDAQFSADNAQRVVELIKSTGKELTTIFISYSDPDYYFGLDLIARQFPNAKIYAAPQTVYLINATKDDKTAIWSPQLGANAPERIAVPAAIDSDHFMLEGRRIEIRQIAGDEQHPFLWIPSARTILGGVYISDAEHLWVADAQTGEDRAKWLTGLDAMRKLDPAYSIPAHFIAGKSSFRGDAPIVFTRNYLTALENALKGATGSEQVIRKMKSLYPGLDGESSLEMTARVLTGETPWKTVSAFPAIGRKAEVNFGGEFDFELDFHNGHSMTFTGLVARSEGRPMTDTVEYTAVEVARGVYMVYWTEKDNTHVVHIEDYGGGIAYTNIVAPDGSFTNLKGTLRLLP
jgi:glyoxylase-like metal-dependent hydrolase (beta-lactamase superfamily II)